MKKALEQEADGDDMPLVEEASDEQKNASKWESTNPTLLVRTDNTPGIPNASRISAQSFRDAISDVVDAPNATTK